MLVGRASRRVRPRDGGRLRWSRGLATIESLALLALALVAATAALLLAVVVCAVYPRRDHNPLLVVAKLEATDIKESPALGRSLAENRPPTLLTLGRRRVGGPRSGDAADVVDLGCRRRRPRRRRRVALDVGRHLDLARLGVERHDAPRSLGRRLRDGPSAQGWERPAAGLAPGLLARLLLEPGLLALLLEDLGSQLGADRHEQARLGLMVK